VKSFSDNVPVSGEQFGYRFDDICNRTKAASGGDQTAANLRNAVYTPDLLNQIGQRTVPNSFDIIGSADPAAVVTVNSQTGYRKGDFFRNEVIADNNNGPVWQSVASKASLTTGASTKTVASNDGKVFVAQTNEVFSYDFDGNLTGDGRWTYIWNGDNQLVSMEELASIPSPTRKMRLLQKL
jgi:hypothetical protein